MGSDYTYFAVSNRPLYTVRGREEKKGRKNIWKDNSLKLPNLVGDLNLLIQEVQQTPSRIKSKRALI